MKKIIALILTAVMALSLCACNSSDYKKAMQYFEDGSYAEALALFEKLGDYQDSAEMKIKTTNELIRQKLVGKWISGEVDVTDSFLSGMGETDDEIMQYVDFGKVTMAWSAEFTDKDVFTLAPEDASYAAMVDRLVKSYKEGLLVYFEDEMTKEAQNVGYSYEQLLKELQLKDTEELFVYSIGMSPDDFCQSVLGDVLTALKNNVAVSGAVKYEDGKVMLYQGNNAEVCTYDLAADTFTMTGEGAPAEEAGMYPITFTRLP